MFNLLLTDDQLIGIALTDDGAAEAEAMVVTSATIFKVIINGKDLGWYITPAVLGDHGADTESVVRGVLRLVVESKLMLSPYREAAVAQARERATKWARTILRERARARMGMELTDEG